MSGYDAQHFVGCEFSVAMTDAIAAEFTRHLDKGPRQEDLTFFLWKPSSGGTRYTAVITNLLLPDEDERILDGNVLFTRDYLSRVLASVPAGCGIGLAHSHLGPGWQGMSHDDIVAERDRLAGAVSGRTQLPIVGITRGTDGSWSGRAWLRAARREYFRLDAPTVRVVGKNLSITYHPQLRPEPAARDSQVATVSVWGERAQADLTRAHVGIVGLGSVGSIVAEALARVGVERVTFIDHDRIEHRNLDRTLGATAEDAGLQTPKVDVATRTTQGSSTAERFLPNPVATSLLTEQGLNAALDCDVLVCCVDRPLPRFVLNVLSNAHLIPVIDGGILARVRPDGRPLHIDWRIHTIGPGKACLHCLGALLRSDVALDGDGKLDDQDYIDNLPPADRERYARRNVFPFSMSVAAHEVLQLVGLIAGSERIGGIGPQHYQAYPGIMTAQAAAECNDDCDLPQYTSSCVDLTSFTQ